MRPASEVDSALRLAQRELDRLVDSAGDCTSLTESQAIAIANVTLLRDVLEWVTGSPVDMDAPHAWLCAYLLDDPPKIDPTPPENN